MNSCALRLCFQLFMDNSPYKYIVFVNQKGECRNIAVCASACVASNKDKNNDTDIIKTTK